jgi:hypothetical protein
MHDRPDTPAETLAILRDTLLPRRISSQRCLLEAKVLAATA